MITTVLKKSTSGQTNCTRRLCVRPRPCCPQALNCIKPCTVYKVYILEPCGRIVTGTLASCLQPRASHTLGVCVCLCVCVCVTVFLCLCMSASVVTSLTGHLGTNICRTAVGACHKSPLNCRQKPLTLNPEPYMLNSTPQALNAV